jgi:hypothetical protein
MTAEAEQHSVGLRHVHPLRSETCLRTIKMMSVSYGHEIHINSMPAICAPPASQLKQRQRWTRPSKSQRAQIQHLQLSFQEAARELLFVITSPKQLDTFWLQSVTGLPPR